MQPKSILVIDDEEGFQDLYRYLLGSLGHRVEAVGDSRQGLKMALENSYDLILLDTHMPHMTGPEVLKKIKAERPDQAVVIFSSSSDPEYLCEDSVGKMGVLACLYKPVDIADILRIVKDSPDSIPPPSIA